MSRDLCTLTLHVRARFRQSILIDDQTYRCDMSWIIALIPGWARLWMLLNTERQKHLMKNSVPMEILQKIAAPVPGTLIFS